MIFKNSWPKLFLLSAGFVTCVYAQNGDGVWVIAEEGHAMPELARFAGNLAGPAVDGVSTKAHFAYPYGIAIDSAGNIYVADGGPDPSTTTTSSNTIRKITPAGNVTTLAGTTGTNGSSDGIGSHARFNFPRGVATDITGNVYVADTHNHTIRKITPNGAVTTLAGVPGKTGAKDGVGAAALFNYPYGIAADHAGNIYVADSLNKTLRKISPTGVVSTLAGTAGQYGDADGIGQAARFRSPHSVVTDGMGNIYVTDGHIIRKVTSTGSVTTFAGTAETHGLEDGIGASARFEYLLGMTLATDGNIYVLDAGALRKITPAGVVITLANAQKVLGRPENAATWDFKGSLAADMAGNFYITDSESHCIRKITPAGEVSLFAGNLPVGNHVDGAGTAATFGKPRGIITDNTGHVYVVDGDATLRKITPAGVVTTLNQGDWNYTYTSHWAQLTKFGDPQDLTTDDKGNVYLTDNVRKSIGGGGYGYGIRDLFNHFQKPDYSAIRKISASGHVSTLVESSTFHNLGEIAIDSTGNIYVADFGNHVIHKIIPRFLFGAKVSVFAGLAYESGSSDGTGATARFNRPRGVAIDAADNMYVADSDNHTIRKITPAGVVTTLAGTVGKSGSADGTGAAARFDSPASLACDRAGNLYVVDHGNHAVRKISPDGVVTTLAGRPGEIGFVAGALPGVLRFPQSVAVHGNSLYITMANGVAVVKKLP